MSLFELVFLALLIMEVVDGKGVLVKQSRAKCGNILNKCDNGLWDPTTGKCDCDWGFSGEFCQLPECGKSGRLKCNPSAGFYCDCGQSLAGKFCEKRLIPCPQNAYLRISVLGEESCTCNQGWKGPECDEILCSEHGVSSENKTFCHCMGGYSGTFCQVNVEFSALPPRKYFLKYVNINPSNHGFRSKTVIIMAVFIITGLIVFLLAQRIYPLRKASLEIEKCGFGKVLWKTLPKCPCAKIEEDFLDPHPTQPLLRDRLTDYASKLEVIEEIDETETSDESREKNLPQNCSEKPATHYDQKYSSFDSDTSRKGVHVDVDVRGDSGYSDTQPLGVPPCNTCAISQPLLENEAAESGQIRARRLWIEGVLFNAMVDPHETKCYISKNTFDDLLSRLPDDESCFLKGRQYSEKYPMCRNRRHEGTQTMRFIELKVKSKTHCAKIKFVISKKEWVALGDSTSSDLDSGPTPLEASQLGINGPESNDYDSGTQNVPIQSQNSPQKTAFPRPRVIISREYAELLWGSRRSDSSSSETGSNASICSKVSDLPSEAGMDAERLYSQINNSLAVNRRWCAAHLDPIYTGHLTNFYSKLYNITNPYL